MRGKPKLIKRTDSAYWFIYIPKQGKQRSQRFSTGEIDYSQAEQVFGQWLLERKKPEISPLDEIKVTQMLTRYEEYKKNDATVGYHMRHLMPYFENVAMSHINNQLLREYADERMCTKVIQGKLSGNKNVSAGTVRRELDTLSAAFGFARREGYIKDVPHIEKPKAAAPRDRWLMPADIGALIAAAGTPYLKLYINIAISTGARPSSILELKWFQVDLDAGLIHFNPEGREQTAKHRPSVRINSYLMPILAHARENTKSEYVIARKNGRRVESIKKGFREACRKAGLSGVVPYTLRHTAITMLIQGGLSLARAGQLAGHSEPRTTARYSKYDPSFTQDAVDILATGAQLAHFSAENIKNDAKSAKNKEKKQ